MENETRNPITIGTQEGTKINVLSDNLEGNHLF